MSERVEPVIPESREVELQPYIDVIDGFCRDMASEYGVPRDLLQRREMTEFWSLAVRAV